MVVFIAIAMLGWRGHRPLHIFIGSACTLLFIIHVILNSRVLASFTKSIAKGKASVKIKLQCLIDYLLIIVWAITIITGFLALSARFGGAASLLVFSRVHGVAAWVGCVIVLIHFIQHIKQIRSYLVRKPDKLI